eukprot:scaffold5222_cov57-Attheya_sp.AAC.1
MIRTHSVADDPDEGEVELVQEVVVVVTNAVNSNATTPNSNLMCRVKLNCLECPSLETCDGRWVRSNCKLHTCGDASFKKKRKSPVFKARPRKGGICNIPDCMKQISKKTWCALNSKSR